MRCRFVGLLAALGVLAGGGQGALAADMPVYKAAPAAVAPVLYNWTGIYIGGQGGYGWSHNDWRDALGPPFNAGGHTATGWLGGLHVGADYQFGSWVIGAEGQYNWAHLRGRHISLVDPADTLETRVHSLATVTGRVGYAFDRILVYGKGGVAWKRDTYVKIDLGVIEGIAGVTRAGWIIGLGAEYAFWNNFSARLEYTYADFGRRRVNLIDPAGGAPSPFDIRQDIQTIMLGLSYRFSWL
jgi:outer membrane immunogenic protein